MIVFEEEVGLMLLKTDEIARSYMLSSPPKSLAGLPERKAR